MCGHGWRAGCCVYLASILFSTIFIGICYFQNKLVIRTEEYKSVYSSFMNIHIFIIFFTITTDVITKQQITQRFWPIPFFVAWIGLMIWSGITIEATSRLEYPKNKKIIEVLKKEYTTLFKARSLDDPFLNVHQTNNCCGLDSFADWKDKVLPDLLKEKNCGIVRNLSCPPDVPQSCCIYQAYCGQHIFEHFLPNETKLHPHDPDSHVIHPKLEDIIYTTPCAKFVEEMTLVSYARLEAFMMVTVLLLILIAITFSYYFWEEQVHNIYPRLKDKILCRKHKHARRRTN